MAHATGWRMPSARGSGPVSREHARQSHLKDGAVASGGQVADDQVSPVGPFAHAALSALLARQQASAHRIRQRGCGQCMRVAAAAPVWDPRAPRSELNQPPPLRPSTVHARRTPPIAKWAAAKNARGPRLGGEGRRYRAGRGSSCSGCHGPFHSPLLPKRKVRRGLPEEFPRTAFTPPRS